MDDDEEVALERDHDSFADATDCGHFVVFELRRSGLDRPEDERARKSQAHQWLTDDAPLQRFDVDGHIGKFRHRLDIMKGT